ncbi:MAG: hypothetical protein EBS76_04360, partial [Actinobacteria bacterium]|nr:hypothetical protein [Actinomycetota bacterium]
MISTVPFRSAISLLSATALSVISIFLVTSAAPEGVQASEVVNYDVASSGDPSQFDGNTSTQTFNIA